jgi:hypothetical protein
MRRVSRVGIVAGTLLGVAQFVRLPATNPPVRGSLAAPAEVESVLRHACYDCHSNETVWPWYSAIAPASWIIRHDVNEGRRRLNFSDWADYESDPETAVHKLHQIEKSVASGDMPLPYYRLLHVHGRLTAAQQGAVVDWCAREAARHSLSH